MSKRENLAKLRTRIQEYRSAPTEKCALAILKLLLRSGRPDEAFRWSKHAKSAFPRSRKADKHYRRLKSERVRAMLREARRNARADGSPGNLVKLAELLRLAGKWKKAFRVATKAREAHPESWQIELALGKLLFDRFTASRSDADGWAAAEHLDSSRCLHPENYSTLILLAITLSRLQSFDDALRIIDEALVVVPDDERATALAKRVKTALAARDHALRTEASDATEATEATSEEPDEEAITSIALTVPGAVAAYAFDRRGHIAEKQTRQSSVFEFKVAPRVIESMASACRLDTDRIGLGALVSCSVSGDAWNLVYHRSEAGPVMTFFEGDQSGEELESRVESVLSTVTLQVEAG